MTLSEKMGHPVGAEREMVSLRSIATFYRREMLAGDRHPATVTLSRGKVIGMG